MALEPALDDRQGAPTAEASSDRYAYDPADPAPSVGGLICCISREAAPPGAYDQSEVGRRPDVLVYETGVLDRDLEVTGPLTATLYVSSSAKDTDFTVKLIDVHPDGKRYNIQESILRARFREGFEKEVFMEPGGVYRLEIDFHATSNVFLEGHRIGLQVSSSNFPRFVRNLNTGGNNCDETEWVVAENTVHHSREYPSHITLPVQARKSHQLPAADADALALRGRAPSSRFDILSSMPAPASGPRGHAGRRLDALATKVGEICGLGVRR